VLAEWRTAGDERVCPYCSSMEGRILSPDEAVGMIPAHDFCRCAFLPVVIRRSR
jgi:SPP1 gp7 family putative phage head morphogenesis protein